ncbi:pleckstrin homology domain-containing family M member 2 isoform X1 [Callorhinchus milii]|uniref:pleckstrin homology domain-containing family M member 2 isoform X1 n=1 Tax=Callorhinchus milii TaxID=7868 RepID=UPI001C3FCAC6|nr:pleckstrin homology domain-containing family M member 2 isoform X1 [Callorhinchus milii]
METLKVKDRILENISLSVKKLQGYFAACEDETPAIRNHDKVLQRLCEHLDHALLYGLQDISSGYWVLVVHFTRSEAVKQIEVQQHVATNLGRSRAWLYLALNENSLESYLRLFWENQTLLHKYYFKNALVCSDDHLTLFLTLVSGLEFIRFELDLDVPYLDVAPYMPEYYKPHNLLDFEERLPNSVQGSDSLSLNSFNSVTSTNLEWDDSAIAPSSEVRWRNSKLPASLLDYDFGDVFPAAHSMPSTDWEEGELTDTISSCPRSGTSESLNKSNGKSPTLRHNPFNTEKVEARSMPELSTVPSTECEREESNGNLQDSAELELELEVIRLAKRKKNTKKKRAKSEERVLEDKTLVVLLPKEEAKSEQDFTSRLAKDQNNSLYLQNCKEASGGEEGSRPRDKPRYATRRMSEADSQPGLLIPQMKDTSMNSVGNPLSEVIERLNGTLDDNSWTADNDQPEQPFRTGIPGDTPDEPPYRGYSERKPPTMDFYRFALESPGAGATSGSDHDTSGDGQQAHVFSSYESADSEACKREEISGTVEEAATPRSDGVETTGTQRLSGQDDLMEVCGPSQEQSVMQPGEPENPNTEGAGSRSSEKEVASSSPVEGKGAGISHLELEEPGNNTSELEGARNSPSELTHSAEFRVDNNLLLLLMIHVFRENEEQLYKMMRMWSGHMEGNLQLLYVLLTDCYIYLLRKGVADKPYNVEEAVSYNELDYISVGLGQQTVQLVCTNRRRQFLLDTADETLTEFFLSALKSAMIKGCREPPYPSILTDATMQRLALTKFVAQESKCEPSEVTIHLYSLIHWEDPLDITAGPQGSLYMPGANSVTKEGLLHYKAGTTYLGSPIWKSSYVVLSNGILYQYPDRTDMMPIISINLAGEQCGGCRRSSITERPHTFHVILTERPALELSAESEKEMADWMQHLCQAVSKGIIPQGVAPSPCIPCCLVVTERLVITCHEDSQTSFFRSLGSAELISVSSISIDPNGEYCLMEFSEDQKQTSPPWFLYFSCAAELERFITALNVAWRSIYQVDLPQKQLQEPCVQRKCEDAVLLIRTTWQRSDSLHRGRSERDPWC